MIQFDEKHQDEAWKNAVAKDLNLIHHLAAKERGIGRTRHADALTRLIARVATYDGIALAGGRVGPGPG